MSKKIEVKPNDRYGRLTIIKEIKQKNKRRCFLCRCDCGNKITVILKVLRNGNVKSCGCLRKEMMINRNITHDMSKYPEYKNYNAMKQRCMDKNQGSFKNYGGAGIKICQRWIVSFKNFYEDMGPKPGPNYSIERINNKGNYEPSNCKWASRSEQNYNQRKRRFCSSKYRGVGKVKNRNKWVARVAVRGKMQHVGYFDTELKAAQAYNFYVYKQQLPNKLNMLVEIKLTEN
jgi:hypothetical protein